MYTVLTKGCGSYNFWQFVANGHDKARNSTELPILDDLFPNKETMAEILSLFQI